ncbi:DUF3159 domain-containing protein [Humidisolicoccus flavus]|uniref:DUF3159 domain-containing protein n=1 Tax=Humidisolicoccus flavus TaxID=3111414 RepID=UPI00324CECAC
MNEDFVQASSKARAADEAGSTSSDSAHASQPVASAHTADAPTDAPRESLVTLLGGSRAAIEASVPPIVFVIAWLLSGNDVLWGAGVAVFASAILAFLAFRRGKKPRAVVLGMLAVVVAALVAIYTGEARNFFIVQLFSNAASALIWMVSIVIRWPFLGIILGAVIGTKATWRKDPVLLRAYQRASWVWVFQYVIRLAVFLPLYFADAVLALSAARVILTWPLVLACLVVSGFVLFRCIPKDHPGIRHPQVAATASKRADSSH